jgi:large subunit ribosomal protein L19
MAKPNPNVPELQPGDIVKVHVRIVEGERERVQIFQGTIIRLRGGGVNTNFTVRRVASHGVGVERTFLLHSTRIEKVEVMRHSKVRRANLYYLRDRVGKAARLKEKR